jgi:hypothetical protein
MEKKTFELPEPITFTSHAIPGTPTQVTFKTLTIRPFEKEEFFSHWDKRLKFEIASRKGDNSIDLYDTGDEEIIGLFEIETPGFIRDLLEIKPALCESFTGYLYTQAGLLCEVKHSKGYESPAETIEQHNSRLLALEVDGKVFLFQKLGRMAYKLMQKEISTHGFVLSKTLAKQVSAQALSEYKEDLIALCDQKPFVYLSIGKMLLEETGIQLSEFAGKA